MSFALQSGNGGFNTAMLQQVDQRNLRQDFQFQFAGANVDRPWDNGILWSRSRIAQGGSDYLLGNDVSYASDSWEAPPQEVSGGQQQKKIVGSTLDSSGAALGGVIVQGFVTATEVYVGQTTSDAGGWYTLTTPYASVAHYVVCYKAGSPDVAGTSLNNLTPS